MDHQLLLHHVLQQHHQLLLLNGLSAQHALLIDGEGSLERSEQRDELRLMQVGSSGR